MQNHFIVIDKNGSEKIIDNCKNIKIVFKGNNSVVKIYEPFKIFGTLYIQCVNDCYTEIQSGLIVYSNMRIHLKNYNKCILGKNFHVHDVNIFNWTEPGIDVTVGNDCLFSSDVNLRTSDGHVIYDNESLCAINKPERGISIGNHVWCGSKVDILKDVLIKNDIIIGTCSLVTKGAYDSNTVIGGCPAKVIKNNVNWHSCNSCEWEDLRLHHSTSK